MKHNLGGLVNIAIFEGFLVITVISKVHEICDI